MTRTLCFITSTRAEFGLLSNLISAVSADPDLDYQLIVTGTHLSSIYGMTISEISEENFEITEKIEITSPSHHKLDLAISAGTATARIAEALDRLKPDILVLVGDRLEILSAAIAATIMGIPIAHIHGGESTVGSFDEVFRHAITKMSHIHFVAAHEYLERVIQLGENPNRVYLTGGLGVDAILNTDLLEKREIESTYGFKFKPKNLLITFHSVTLELGETEKQFCEILSALEELTDTQLIFTYPNADPLGLRLIEMINTFASGLENVVVFESLGRIGYFSIVAQVDAVVGNSSSGLLEVPTLKTATINIGDRQRGRLKSPSVIDCLPEKNSVLEAIKKVYSEDFGQTLQSALNPYGDGGSVNSIKSILKDANLNLELKKEFYNLKFQDMLEE
jgi:GDP/UDP-N,N'-diacetylbacillosamine 2-epimerase (hydrolysing)